MPILIGQFRLVGIPQNKGGVTVALDKESKKYAVSVCSPSDNFNRKKGFRAATERLKGGRVAGILNEEVDLTNGPSINQALLSIARECAEKVACNHDLWKAWTLWSAVEGVTFRKKREKETIAFF